MNEIVFLNGRYINKKAASISPDDRGFLFADGVYEVVRVYNGNLFQMEDHVERLAASLEGLKIGGVAPDSLLDISNRLVIENTPEFPGTEPICTSWSGATPSSAIKAPR